MKDNFSSYAKQYAQFRPHYPPELYSHLLQLVKEKITALDVGTGNGQVAGVLADYFEQVYATDISEEQLKQAVQKPNIRYSVGPGEKLDFPDQQFDLITVAQAIHWFRFHEFYSEVKRTLKPGGIIAVIGYGVIIAPPELQLAIDHLYKNIVGPYWDAERRYIDEGYQTIPFPFEEISVPALQMEYEWTREQLIGYINTWSAVKHFIKKNGYNPVDAFAKELLLIWKNDMVQRFCFPLLLRVGVVN